MRLTLLDALPAGPLAAALPAALSSLGAVTRHDLAAAHLAPCQGCFACWTASPGACRLRDGANGLMAEVQAADTVVWATPVRFGAWSPVAKSAIDRMIGLLSPFFAVIDGETHHARRYPRAPAWGVVAVPHPDESAEDLGRFQALVHRNSRNFYAGTPWVAVVPPAASPDALGAAIAAAQSSAFGPPPGAGPSPRRGGPRRGPGPRHVVLWVGSPKAPGTSTSERLGRALLDALTARGWTAEVLFTRAAVRLHGPDAPALRAAAARADLLVLTSPIYVDTLPAPVLAGLDVLAAPDTPRPPLLALLQCGFPETAHTAPARALLEAYAAHTGHALAGVLAVGAGGALGPGSLTGGAGWRQGEALAAAAAALDAGGAVSDEVEAAFAVPGLAPLLYRWAGAAGWLMRGWESGALWELDAQPWAPAPGD